MKIHRALVAFCFVAGSGCPPAEAIISEGDDGSVSTDAGSEDAGIACAPCVTSADCGQNGACVQFEGSDLCFARCGPADSCAPGEHCLAAVAEDGTQVGICAPISGCGGGTSCPAMCPPDTVCQSTTGQCEAPVSGIDAGADGGAQPCGTLVSPSTRAGCHSCTPDAGTCQPNGCYGGWWCDLTGARCKAPPTMCGSTSDAGVADAGVPDAGARDGGALAVGPDGGVVDHLFFAVVGDTRPPLIDDTANYPTAIITSIYQSIDAMEPRPQFVVTTGDYMFARPAGTQGAVQLEKYLGARANYRGTLFPALGNHECTGATAGNCATTSTASLASFRSMLLGPIGRSTLYYAFDVNEPSRQWTAKFIVAACNAWDATQAAWLTQQLTRPTTFTFVIRHEPLGVAAPCTTEMDALVAAHPYTMLLVGHTHTYSHSGRQLVEGVGGAPISGSAVYGFATIEQLSIGFQVTQYETGTRRVVSTFTVAP